MVHITFQTVLLSLALLPVLTTAHPGHGGLDQEIAERTAYLKHTPRNLNHCADKLRARGVHDQSLARRMATLQDLQEKAKLRKRSLVARQSSSTTVSSASKQLGTPPPKPSESPLTLSGSPPSMPAGTPPSMPSGSPPPKSSRSPMSKRSESFRSMPSGSAPAMLSGTPPPMSSGSPSILSGSRPPKPSGSPLPKLSGSPHSMPTGTPLSKPSGLPPSNPSGSTSSKRSKRSASPPSSSNGASMGPGSSNRSSTQNITEFGATVANTSHLSTLSVNPNTTDVASLIFGNNSCILNPEATIGPYYVQGELIRSDISEDQEGVPLYLDQQYIDISTCEPIADLYADIWHANATGVYAGIVASGNGNSNDSSNLNSTFLRGIQKTDGHGVVAFQTVFPGYYQGRTTHIHMVTHTGATALANGTIAGGNVTHIGQLMFDQVLTDDINAAVSPYTSNTQTITSNAEDSVFIGETQADSDPVVNYVLLGDDYADGIFAWITIGVDPAASYDASAAAVLTEDGGYTADNSQGMDIGMDDVDMGVSVNV